MVQLKAFHDVKAHRDHHTASCRIMHLCWLKAGWLQIRHRRSVEKAIHHPHIVHAHVQTALER